MITVLSGQPGNGKTSWVINEIKRELEKGRVIYTCGIPKIDLPVIPISRGQLVSWSEREILPHELDDDGEPIYRLTQFKEGSLFIVDEAQKTFAPCGSKVPDHISYLSEHRHHGLDFIMITQSPTFLNSYVDENTSKHLHIRSTWRGRKIYEWPEVQSNPTSSTSLTNAAVKPYKIDPSTFQHYESASLHTKIKHTVPLRAWFFGFILVLLPVLIYYSFTRIYTKTQPKEDTHILVTSDPVKISQKPNQEFIKNMRSGKYSSKDVLDSDNVRPLYSLPSNIRWDKIKACLASIDRCACYDSYAVQVLVPDDLCRQASEKGWQVQSPLYDGSIS